METKKHNTTVSRKGGRNPFGKITFMAGGLTIGAALAEAVEKWRLEHPEQTVEPVVDKPEDVISEEPVAENNGSANTDSDEDEVKDPSAEQEPQPIDPEESHISDESITSTVDSGETVDEVAERIANSEDIDSVDDNFVAFMNVGEHRTVYTETGEVDAFSIEINDPNLAGYPFMLADTDGDGFYETVLMADGTPANIGINAGPGEPDSLDYYLAQANISISDLEEMHETGGGYMAPDAENETTQYDDPTSDMIDEQGHQVATETIAQNNQVDSTDDEDEQAYLLLLAQLLEDDDDDEEEDITIVESDEIDDDSELASEYDDDEPGNEYGDEL